MLKISGRIYLDEEEIQFSSIRAQGSGGQNVNKVSSAIHLRFDIKRSSLPEECKERLLKSADWRISKDGIVIIKAQRFRAREKNREDAIARLVELIRKASHVQKSRKSTKPSLSARKARMDSKTRRGQVKNLRSKVREHD